MIEISTSAVIDPRMNRGATPAPSAPRVHETARVVDSTLGEWVYLGPRTSLNESTFGDYSYTAGDVQIIYSEVGRFCSIASQVRLNPGNHPMERVTQHHMTYRRRQYGFGADDEAFFDWRRDHKVTVGHDVWIGHGAVLLPGVNGGGGGDWRRGDCDEGRGAVHDRCRRASEAPALAFSRGRYREAAAHRLVGLAARAAGAALRGFERPAAVLREVRLVRGREDTPP